MMTMTCYNDFYQTFYLYYAFCGILILKRYYKFHMLYHSNRCIEDILFVFTGKLLNIPEEFFKIISNSLYFTSILKYYYFIASRTFLC